ncbi:hypothetical protein B0H19DRAFT_1365195 [Mycena capillaripes]|nr:hypothetical protein B0H19DRAFT_1365195 [Mycena capillaripes]
MTTIHTSPPNMVPTIPSGTLPQTPASEWAEGMTDLLSGHVTRTPVGTPGPAVPGGFPSHLEPDPVPNSSENTNGASVNGEEPLDSLLASAQAFLPTMATAKAYLPQGVAAYLPSSETLTTPASESSLPPLTPSSSSLSSPSLPRQDSATSTTVDSGHDEEASLASADTHDPSPDRGPIDDSAALSTTAHTGHSSSAIHPPSASSSPSVPRPTSGLLPAHPGVARGYSASSITSTISRFPSPPTENGSSPLVQSPAALTPSASTDLALSADSSKPPPQGSPLYKSLPQEQETETETTRPRATSGLLPSHPAAMPGGGGEERNTVHAIPTHAYQGAHPTPHAVPPTPGEANTSTPSLVPSTGGDSGYAASTEPGSTVATPGEGEGEAAFSSISTPGLPSYAQQTMYDAGAPGAGVQGGAAPNSSRVPTGDSDPLAPAREGEGDAPRVKEQGSPALHSSRLADNAPTGGVSQDADADAEGDADGDADEEEGGEEQEGGHTDGKKKPKLMQRLKEKMHVGGGGGGSA